MRLDHRHLRQSFRQIQMGRASDHSADDRMHPSLLQYDYLSLSRLARDVHDLIEAAGDGTGRTALDLGSATSPYREWLLDSGYSLRTFDIEPTAGADYTAASGDRTGLPDESFDLIICTQVLEHVPDPRSVLAEVHRLLRPGGCLVASVPHVWFYHPHPGDYWRFTQEGVAQLCLDSRLELLELRAQGGSALTFFQCVNFLLYGVLGRGGLPLYAIVNVVGAAFDHVITDTLFAHNFAWLARRSG